MACVRVDENAINPFAVERFCPGGLCVSYHRDSGVFSGVG